MNAVASPGWASISFDDFHAWAEAQTDFLHERAFFNEAEYMPEERVQFHKGDLVAEKILVAPVTVVDGNLTVSEINWDFDTGLLVVTGDLNIAYIGKITLDIVVGGNVIAQSMCINTLNDYCLRIGGDLHCEFLAEAGCYIEVMGKIVCPKVLSIHNEIVAHGGIRGELIDIDDNTHLVSVLSDEVLDSDNYIDEAAFENVVRSGRSPYRNAP